MGTINYGTSDFITLGYNCNIMGNDDRDFWCGDLYDQIAYRLKQERFTYFHITVKPGYYEGLFLDIENNYPVCYDDYRDKRDAQKEITQIRALLLEFINDFECVSCYPGWCMGYADYTGTLEDLADAIREMRETVRNTPTYAQYIKQGA